MDPRHEIMENLDKYLIGLDDTFSFTCQMCGKCCINREDILLTPRDLYNTAKYLEMNISEFYDKYCEGYIGHSSNIPIIRLKPVGMNKRCALLIGKQCMVYDSNPVVRALYPIDRINIVNPDGTYNKEISYILSDTSNKKKHKYTVRQWLEKFRVSIDDDFFFDWNELILFLSKEIVFARDEKKATPKALNMIWNVIFTTIYLNYSIEKDFES